MRFILFACLRIHNHCRVRTVANVHRTHGWREAMRMCRHVTSTWSRLDWRLTGWRCCVCTYAHYRNMYSLDTSMMYVHVWQGTLFCPTSTVWTQCLVSQVTLHENLCSKFLRETRTANLLVKFLVNCDEILYWKSALSAGQVRFIFVCKGYHLEFYI